MNNALWQLNKWENKHYRDELHEARPCWPLKTVNRKRRNALDELTQIMDLEDVYEFQK